MKSSFEKVNQAVLHAFSYGWWKEKWCWKDVRNSILESHGWTYLEYEEAVFQNL